MKKLVLLCATILCAYTLQSQTVITGWTFPTNSGPDSLNANLGLTGNLGYDLRFEGNDTTYDVIYFADGAADYAAAAQGWDNGANEKYWSIKFKAENYHSFMISSKQYSEAEGPRDFKLQWRLSGGTLEDVPGGTVTVGTDWTAGVVTDLLVPITGQGTSSIYLVWMMNSNTSVGGGTVTSTGATRIDDILVTAIPMLGNNEILFSNRLTLTPNPNHGRFTVNSTVALKEIRLVDMSGRQIFAATDCGTTVHVTLPDTAKGTFALQVKFTDQDAWYARKIVVE